MTKKIENVSTGTYHRGIFLSNIIEILEVFFFYTKCFFIYIFTLHLYIYIYYNKYGYFSFFCDKIQCFLYL